MKMVDQALPLTNGDVFEFLCSLAPISLQMDFDNSGFLMGRKAAAADTVLLSLDVTESVISEAEELGAKLIVSHHPLIFGTVKSVTDEKLLRLAQGGISVISMHTNLDIADGGVNDVLISAFGAYDILPLDEDGCGRIGTLEGQMTLSAFLPICKDILASNGLRYYDAGKSVKRLAVMGGSGGDSLAAAAEKGCDTYLTADIKYHNFLEAEELGINLIDGDHFCTENLVLPVIANKMRARFPKLNILVSSRHRQIVSFA